MSGPAAWAASVGVLVGSLPAVLMRMPAPGPAQAGIRPGGKPILLPTWLWMGLGAAVGLMIGVRFAHCAALPAYLVFVACVVPLSVYDLAHSRIPDKLLGPAAAIGVFCFGLAAMLHDGSAPLLRSLLGALGVAGTFFVIALLAGGGFGLGDVKLLAFLALLEGFKSWDSLVRGPFVGLALAAVVGLLARRAYHSKYIPLAPCLILGALVALVL